MHIFCLHNNIRSLRLRLLKKGHPAGRHPGGFPVPDPQRCRSGFALRQTPEPIAQKENRL